MLIKRTWTKYDRKTIMKYYYTGYFLFGFIPIFIDRDTSRLIQDVQIGRILRKGWLIFYKYIGMGKKKSTLDRYISTEQNF